MAMKLYIVIHNVKMEYTRILHETKSDFLCNLTKEKQNGKRTVEGALGVYMGHTKPPTKCHEIIFQQKDY